MMKGPRISQTITIMLSISIQIRHGKVITTQMWTESPYVYTQYFSFSSSGISYTLLR